MKVQFMVTLEMSEEPKDRKALEGSIKTAILREKNEHGLTGEDDPAVVQEVVSVDYARTITLMKSPHIKA